VGAGGENERVAVGAFKNILIAFGIIQKFLRLGLKNNGGAVLEPGQFTLAPDLSFSGNEQMGTAMIVKSEDGEGCIPRSDEPEIETWIVSVIFPVEITFGPARTAVAGGEYDIVFRESAYHPVFEGG